MNPEPAASSPGGAPVQFRILGSVEISVGSGPVRVRAPKQRQLLMVLLSRPNAPVSVDYLVNALWPEDPPASAAQNLRGYVYQLRRLLGDEGKKRIVHDQDGYALMVEPWEVDAGRFEELVERGQRALTADLVEEAAATFAEALGLWCGPAFGGLDAVDCVREEAVRLTELRLAVLEKWIDADLQLGRHRERVADLVRLVVGHPLRERFRAQLMLALYRSDRRAEALQIYREARQVLVAELGLEPGPELRRLEQAILTADPGLDPAAPADTSPSTGPHPSSTVDPGPEPLTGTAGGPAPAPQRAVAAPTDAPEAGSAGGTAPIHGVPERSALVEPPRIGAVPCLLPADMPDLTAREAQLEVVIHTLTEGTGTALPVTALTGRGGVGKTSLAVHAAHRLRAVFSDGQLYVNLQGAEASPAEPAAVLTRLLRALGIDGSAIPIGTEERAEMYRARLAGQRMLVVLDNAMDEAQVQPLLPGSASCGVIVTSRTRLTGLTGSRLVELDILSDDEAVSLLARSVGPDRVGAEPAAARELVRLCGCLPLALRIVGARLAAHPHWTLARMVARLADERRRLDELTHSHLDVRASLMLSYQGLGASTRRLFALLGLLDAPDFPAWVAAAVDGTTVDEAEDRLDSLAAARLLDPAGADPTGHVRYRFHDLVRVFARERGEAELPPAVRFAALARTFGALLGLAEQAHQNLTGVDHLVVHGTAPRHPLPPGLAHSLTADPVAWCEVERLAIVAAARQASAAGMDELCWDLAVTTAPLFEVHGHQDDWLDTHEHALRATRSAGNRRGEAAVLAELAELYIEQHRYTAAAERLDAAVRLFADVDDPYGRALALLKVAILQRINGRHVASLRTAEGVLAVLRMHGDLGNQALLLRCVGQVHLERRRLDLAQPYLEQALDLAQAAAARRLHGQIQYRLGELYLDEQRLDLAEAALTAVLALVRKLGDLVGEAHALSGLGRTRLAQRRYEEAAALLSQALSICQHAGERMVEASVRLALGQLWLEQGELDLAQSAAESAVTLGREINAPLWEARALKALGDVDAAAGHRLAAEEAWRRSRALFADIGAVADAEPQLI